MILGITAAHPEAERWLCTLCVTMSIRQASYEYTRIGISVFHPRHAQRIEAALQRAVEPQEEDTSILQMLHNQGVRCIVVGCAVDFQNTKNSPYNKQAESWQQSIPSCSCSKVVGAPDLTPVQGCCRLILSGTRDVADY